MQDEFLKLLMKHEGAIRAYIRPAMFHADEVDEVMQEVSLIAWKKFDQLEDPQKFAAWACVIARYEILKFRRKKARDRLQLDEDVIENLTEEALEENETRDSQLKALKDCLGKLPQDRSKLLQAAYAPGATIRQIALSLGKKEMALYQQIRRLRVSLADCVQRNLDTSTS